MDYDNKVLKSKHVELIEDQPPVSSLRSVSVSSVRSRRIIEHVKKGTQIAIVENIVVVH